MSIQSSSSSFQTLQNQLDCPVFLEPLTEAVSLVPCAHKIQEAAAKQLFGPANGEGWKIESQKACPICRVSVQGYLVDHFTRGVVKQFAALSTEVELMINLVKNPLPGKIQVPAVQKPVKLSYPGKSAHFVHKEGDWNEFYSGVPLCRQMVFVSSTTESLIRKFRIMGYVSGNIVIGIEFPSKCKELHDYLKTFGVILDNLDLKWGYYSSKNPEGLKAMFKIVSENNTIPAPYLDKIIAIVEKGSL